MVPITSSLLLCEFSMFFFLVPVFVLYWKRCLVCALLQNFSFEGTGRWNNTEKLCMAHAGDDKHNKSNVTQTRCRCRKSLE